MKNSSENKVNPSHTRLKSQVAQFLSNKDPEPSNEKPSESKTTFSYNNKPKPMDSFNDLNDYLKVQQETRLKWQSLEKDSITTNYHQRN